jgi:MOSC domain-containing protein YiiM
VRTLFKDGNESRFGRLYIVMHGHGGSIARVLEGGVIRLGDTVAYEKFPAQGGES